MLELAKEFEATKAKLLAKLPQYLTNKGININAPFTCLNPNDLRHEVSMYYDANSFTVHCPSCNASFNIFDLIGIDYQITGFSQQFIRAHKLFLGEIPIVFLDILKKMETDTHQPRFGESSASLNKPLFEIANDNEVVPENKSSFGLAENKLAKKGPQEFDQTKLFNRASPFDEAKIHPFGGIKATSSTNAPAFGENLNTPKNELNLNQFKSFPSHIQAFGESNLSNQPKFGESSSQNSFANVKKEINLNHMEYIRHCSSNVGNCDYFKQRGLSDEIIKRFNLGYDEKFHNDGLSSNQANTWKAAIIPYGNSGFCARNISKDAQSANERYKKHGYFGIYNDETLNQRGDIFICEGEFDALSLETLGFKAIALGGSSNVQIAVESIKNCKIAHNYYLCLDNDEAGLEASNKLSNLLAAAGIATCKINLAYPFKDINEILCQSPDRLKKRLDNLNKILSFKFDSIKEPELALKYIASPDDLDSLDLSDVLYTFCGNPQILRRLVSNIVIHKYRPIIYVGSSNQCDNLKRLLAVETIAGFNKNTLSHLKLLAIDDNDYVDKFIEGIEAQILLSNSNFVTIVDVTAFKGDNAIELLKQLGKAIKTLKLPIVALCNQRDASYFEAISAQNLNIILDDNANFACQTLGPKGLPIIFTKTYDI